MEEEANMLDGEMAYDDPNRPLSNYEKSKMKTNENREKYGMNPDNWPEGKRPADQSKNDCLLGGANDIEFENQDYEGNVFDNADEHRDSNKPRSISPGIRQNIR